MDDLIVEFTSETRDNLNALDAALLMLEDFPDDEELLGKIFRNLHTIKGTCGFLGLNRLAKIAHSSETLLEQFRSGQRRATPSDVALILKSIDAIRALVDAVHDNGAEPEGDDSALIASLEEALSSSATPVTDLALVAPAADAPPPAPSKTASTEAPNNFLRVHVDTLESLMTRVSELVLMRNQLLQITRDRAEDPILEKLEQLNLVVSELQDSVMKTRMQPVGSAWAALPRIVHDVSRSLGKKIRFEMSGEETEIDRQVLDLIKDPLVHMTRNSADHGIETPSERLAAGKSETGIISLSAEQEGGYIIIRLRDDGRGLNAEKIRMAAINRGIASAEQAANLPDSHIFQYIFEPGFSTAESITEVSGRGVGMDVVRTNIEKIGGAVFLESTPGQGACFTIRIPLTLAIVPALIVESAEQRYAVPQLNVREILRIAPNSEFKIDNIGGTPVVCLREQILPLVSLHDVLSGEKTSVPDNCHIVITSIGAASFGIIVDEIRDTEEIVVKPLSSLLRPLSIYGGNTILGDGSVILILDPAGLARVTRIDLRQHDTTAANINVHTDNGLTTLLVFTTGSGAPKAVPAFLVSHIHEFATDDIEESGGKMLLQHRDRLMPLYTIEDHKITRDRQKALVFIDDFSGMSFAVMIADVLDIVEATLDINAESARPGILGTAIVSERATDILDINHFTGARDWEIEDRDINVNRRRILIVDDSPFFRHMLQPLLSMAGYAVTMAENPRSAMALCDKGVDFDLILSDIEMDGMNGLDFATRVKAGSRWKDVPMVALSSHATPQDIEAGKASGFSAYIPKSDKNALLSTLSAVFERAHDAKGKMQ